MTLDSQTRRRVVRMLLALSLFTTEAAAGTTSVTFSTVPFTTEKISLPTTQTTPSITTPTKTTVTVTDTTVTSTPTATTETTTSATSTETSTSAPSTETSTSSTSTETSTSATTSKTTTPPTTTDTTTPPTTTDTTTPPTTTDTTTPPTTTDTTTPPTTTDTTTPSTTTVTTTPSTTTDTAAPPTPPATTPPVGLCPPGTFNDSGGCRPCPVGTFQPFIEQANCTSCPEGFNTSGEGATALANCSTLCELASGSCLHDTPCSEAAPGEYQCNCTQSGYNGSRCETDIDECVVNTALCQNGGTCYNQIGSFQCICVEDQNNQYAGVYCEQILTREPIILDVEPLYGPLAGGTKLTVTGNYFAEIPPTLVVLDKAYLSRIIDYNVTHLWALTPPGNLSDLGLDLAISMVFAGGLSYPAVQKSYQYKPDPVIKNIFPTSTIIKGGTSVTVQGQFLQSVAHPVLTLSMVTRRWTDYDANNKIYSETNDHFFADCTTLNDTLMVCTTPVVVLPPDVNVTSSDANNTVSFDTEDLQLAFYAGFQLDGLETYLNVSESSDPELAAQGTFSIKLVPEVYRMAGIVTYEEDVPLLFQGKDLYAIAVSDYVVEVETGFCDIFEVTASAIHCQLPYPPPEKRNDSTSDNHRLVVNVGRNIRLSDMGSVHYEDNWSLIIGLSVSLGLLALIVFIIVAILCSRKRLQKARGGSIATLDSDAWVDLRALPEDIPAARYGHLGWGGHGASLAAWHPMGLAPANSHHGDIAWDRVSMAPPRGTLASILGPAPRADTTMQFDWLDVGGNQHYFR